MSLQATWLRAGTLGVVAAFGVGLSAQAQVFIDPQFEVSIGYTQLNQDRDEEISLGAVTIRGGIDFSPYLGFEAEGSVGVFDDSGVDLDNAFGGFAKGTFLVTPHIDIHARGGFAQLEFSGVDDTSDESEESGLAAGIGGEWFPGGAHQKSGGALRFDYLRYFLDDEDANAVTFTYHYRF